MVLSSLHPQIGSGGKLARWTDQEHCLSCQIQVLPIDLDDPLSHDHGRQFVCLTDANGEGGILAEIPYQIDLPHAFVEQHMTTLQTGLSTICIPGGRAIRLPNSTLPDQIVIPEGVSIQVVDTGAEETGESQVVGLGNRTVLVVRVLGTADNGAEQPAETRDRLAGAVFGLGNEPFSNSMRAQYNRCSFGQLVFVPADGHPLISNGVMDVALNFSLQGRDVYRSRRLFHEETAALLGVNSLETAFDHVMFCVAAGTVFSFGSRSREWTALGLRETYSYFNSKFLRCDKLSALMHEMGHNLGLHHSGERDSQFGDTTGVVRTNAIGLPCPQIHSNVCPSCLRYRWVSGKEKFNFRPVVGSLTL